MADNHTDASADAELRPLRASSGTGSGRAELAPEARLLGRAFQQLSDEPLPELPVAGWAALEESAQRLARRRRWRYHLIELWRGLGPAQLGLCAAAATLVLVLGTLGARSLSSSGSSHGRPGVAERTLPTLINSKADVREQLQLQAGSSPSETTLRCGAELQVADGSAEIDQREPHRPRIRLQRGRVALHVPPMPTGGSLVVATSDAEVIVHGTRFLVDRREQEDVTAVSVQEGLVEVRPLGGKRSTVFLHAGEQVVVPSTASYLRQLDAQVGEVIESGRCDDQASQLVTAYLSTAAPTLDVSAALYLSGSCAAARGDVPSALGSFERVAASSGSALRADNALARSAQLRAAANATDGALAWRRYLEQFPQGQHRESAQRYLRELLLHRTPN